MENISFLIENCAAFGLKLSEAAAKKLIDYCKLVLDANEKFNLTAIKDEDAMLKKHILDSLFGAPLIPQGAKVIDIGSGAGFPSAPLAIAREDISVTALDATLKKVNFTNESAKALKIDNLKAVCGRAEEQKQAFYSCEIVTARAVAPLQILLEICTPFLKIGGKFIAYKTDESELALSQNAMKVLNVAHKKTVFCSLPDGDKRALLVFEKIGKTDARYPRAYGAIKKKPL